MKYLATYHHDQEHGRAAHDLIESTENAPMSELIKLANLKAPKDHHLIKVAPYKTPKQ